MNQRKRLMMDLERAIKKPLSQRSWVMVIDIRKCVGCTACVVACAAENVCSPQTSYRWVFDQEFGDYPNLDRFFMPTNCQQCDNPPCKKAADRYAKGLIIKRQDGIVKFDYIKLANHRIAAKTAKEACPYNAISYDNGRYYTDHTPRREPYETRTFFAYGDSLNRNETAGSIRKCTFCAHRLDNGMLPACVTTCIGDAMYFGDANDPKSKVHELMRKNRWNPYGSLGTKPRVYYIGYEKRANIAFATNKTCEICHAEGSKP